MESFESMNEIPIIGLINYINSKGITGHFYRRRAEILLDVTPKKQLKKIFGNSYLLRCEIDAKELASKLFALTPSFIEKSTCTEGCSKRFAKIVTFAVSSTAFQDPLFKDVINEYGLLKITKICPKNEKHGFIEKTISETG